MGNVTALSATASASPRKSLEPLQSPSSILGEGSGLPGPRHSGSSPWGSGSGRGSRGVEEDLAGATSMLLSDLEMGVELVVD
jgi:hypothetical protein